MHPAVEVLVSAQSGTYYVCALETNPSLLKTLLKKCMLVAGLCELALWRVCCVRALGQQEKPGTQAARGHQ